MLKQEQRKRPWLSTHELVLFAVFAALMIGSTYAMQVLPNIHLLAMLMMTLTIVYGWRALIPTYVFAVLYWLIHGMTPYMSFYLYIWAFPVIFAMCIPKKTPKKLKFFLYPLLCALHGFLFGTLASPVSAGLIFGFDLPKIGAYIVAGLWFDVVHGISNFCLGFLILPLSSLLFKLEQNKLN